ncbi:hypothetical protein AB1Y20_009349 [Prymnesium parvum]|uniref:Peptidyl-prolyl cis-trans isomerase C n=1 Tax=Prymnesium parvum TaxID=97485 RepID=A0AB34K436_PRYPA
MLAWLWLPRSPHSACPPHAARSRVLTCDSPSLSAPHATSVRPAPRRARLLCAEGQRSSLDPFPPEQRGNNRPSRAAMAAASHILLQGAGASVRADRLLVRINGGEEDFAEAARKFSLCPSGARAGGSLGRFGPGRMVPEFDRVVFDSSTQLGLTHKVETKFGVHLVRVDARDGAEGNGERGEKELPLGEGGDKELHLGRRTARPDGRVVASFPKSLSVAGFEPGYGWDDNEGAQDGHSKSPPQPSGVPFPVQSESMLPSSDNDSPTEAGPMLPSSELDLPGDNETKLPSEAAAENPAPEAGLSDDQRQSSAAAGRLWKLQEQERMRAAALLQHLSAANQALSREELLELRSLLASLVYSLSLSQEA